MNYCVSTPIVVENKVYMDGLCGGAYVVIDDGRTSFVRWLRKNGVGHRHYKRGYSIPADQIDQSSESASAYAKAFALVLRRNGIECHTETYLT